MFCPWSFRGHYCWCSLDAGVTGLKEEGQFFEAKQLAEMEVGTLQPRFGACTWAVQAWNMAYNISVAIPALATWTEMDVGEKTAMKLLGIKGIYLNPRILVFTGSLRGYFCIKSQVLWMIAHLYIKLQLAESMQPLLGTGDNGVFPVLVMPLKNGTRLLRMQMCCRFINALKAIDPVFGDEKNFVNNYLSASSSPSKFQPDTFK